SVAIAACGPAPRHQGDGDGGSGGPDGTTCPRQCAADLHSVLDCNGNMVQACSATEACDTSQLICADACLAAESNHRSAGCDYYATDMDSYITSYCFATFV